MTGCEILRVHEAFQQGDVERLKALLGNPVDFPNSPSPSAAIGNFLEYAVYHSPLSLVLALGAQVDYEHSGFPCLIAAVSTDREDKPALIEMLLSFGADIEQRGFNDYTPLHYAVRSRDWQSVKVLLDHGADPHARTRIDDCSTPLEDAARHGPAEIAEMLRRAAATKHPK